MKTSDADILFIPGIGPADAQHWQQRWAARLSTGRVVPPEDTRAPRRDPWVDAIRAEVAGATRPVVLVAHSLGAHAVAHAASGFEEGKVRGALLVAPPAEKALRAIAAQTESPADFTPLARMRLPFPALFIASRTDPFAPYQAQEALSADWGAKLVDAGASGHFNVESGHGPWPEGLMTFASFLRGL